MAFLSFDTYFKIISRCEDSVSMKAGKPCCPNHGEPLEGIPQPMPNKGTGVCPVSGYSFEYEVDTANSVAQKDKFGNVSYEYDINIIGNEKNN